MPYGHKQMNDQSNKSIEINALLVKNYLGIIAFS